MQSGPFSLLPAVALPLLFCGLPAAAEEAAPDPHALHAENCVRCHGSEVYTRPDRKVTSFDALGRQVRMCETNLELRWFDDEIAAVRDYLNRDYYRFTPKQ